MSPAALALPLLLALSGSRPGTEADARPIVATDHVQHSLVSFAGSVYTFSVVRAAGLEAREASWAALATMAAAGLVKELSDRARGGRFDGADLIANAVGLAIGGMLIRAMR